MKMHSIEICHTYKYRMYTRGKGDKHLHQMINVAGRVWNHSIALQRRYYRLTGKYIPPGELKSHLAKLRRETKRFAYWNAIPAQSIQASVERLDTAYQKFFNKKAGRPGFKKVRKYRSFVLKQTNWKLLEDKNPKYDKERKLTHAIGRIFINGRLHKFVKHREMGGIIKTITIKRDTLDRLWICFTVRETIEVPKEVSTGQIGGFDFGLKTFLVDEQGRPYQSPQFLRQELHTIRQRHRALSRKQVDSNNREWARRLLARAHIRIADKRRDEHYKLAHDICKIYQAVVFEDLNLRGMKALWGRKVSDLGFAKFLVIMQHNVMPATIGRR
jgi:putative transposase